MLINELKKYFGFDSFRPGQEEIIQALLDGEDTLAILPTGTGKSLCYQLTGYLTDGMVLIVSPLLSLMEDQVTQLQKRGEKRVAAFNSLLSRAERGYVLRHLSQYKFLFLSPEMLTNPSLLEQLKKQDIALYVVDEAVDFRPEYQQLGKIREHLGNPVTLALTATATDLVAKDIRQVLFDRQPKEVRQSVNRQNISLFVRKTQQKEQELEQFMESAHGAAIIYCATKKEVERLYHLFRERFSVGYYHGGLDTAQRRQLQQQFVKNQLQFLIATNAFGMGIDKSDIRYVIHYDLPDSLENYVQEIGRAGRDQEESAAILLYQSGDERIHYFFNQLSREQRQSFELYLEYAAEQAPFDELQKKWMELIQQSEKPENWVERLKRQEKEKEFRLQQMLRYIHEEDCRRKFILAYFGEELSVKPQNCCDIDGAKVELLPKKKAFSKTEPLHWESILLNLFKKNMEH